jgi:transglutaminase-like putative cysteine protease
MKYRVVHRTEYSYEEPVTLCYNEAHLRPRDTERQRVSSHRTLIEPPAAVRSERRDFFGNSILHFAIQSSHVELTVTAASEIEIDAGLPSRPTSAMSWEQAIAAVHTDVSPAGIAARQYVLQSPMVDPTPEVETYARRSFDPNRPLLEAVTELMRRIHADFVFDPEFTIVSTPVSEVFEHGRGVCQDFAHVGIACLRSLGVPARYLSGYIETLPPPGEVKLVGADASHAWLSVYLPDAGWVDFDPTNDQLAGDKHIVTAWGRDYSDVAPLKGIIFGGGSKPTTRVAVDVVRIGETPAPVRR